MGWLFGSKKKVPRVPLPEGQVIDEKALRFPSGFSEDRIIEPDQVKQAVGANNSFSFPEMETPIEKPMRIKNNLNFSSESTINTPTKQPLFIKVEVYQKILGEIEELRSDMKQLDSYNSQLEGSEYNEENNFLKLKRSVNVMHDRLLQVDKTIFKAQ